MHWIGTLSCGILDWAMITHRVVWRWSRIYVRKYLDSVCEWKENHSQYLFYGMLNGVSFKNFAHNFQQRINCADTSSQHHMVCQTGIVLISCRWYIYSYENRTEKPCVLDIVNCITLIDVINYCVASTLLRFVSAVTTNGDGTPSSIVMVNRT